MPQPEVLGRNGTYVAVRKLHTEVAVWRQFLRADSATPEDGEPVAELQERTFEFDIQVQLCTDLERMPVEDVTVEWPESLSPYVTVAKLRLPAVSASSASHAETACRVSSSSTGSRPRSVSQRLKYRTL